MDNENNKEVNTTSTQNVDTTNQATNNASENKNDYKDLQDIIEKRMETVMNSFFSKKGLDGETLKAEKEKFKEEIKPSINLEDNEEFKKIKEDLASAKQIALDNENKAKAIMIEKTGTLLGLELGIDIKNIQHVMKLADLSNVFDKDGNVDSEKMKESINKVLEDVPAFKAGVKNTTKIVEIGGKENITNDNKNNQYNVAQKKWNKFNR